MKTVDLDTAPPLKVMIAQIKPGEEIVLTDHASPVARLTKTSKASKKRARGGIWGNSKGFWMSPDFDAPLEQFRDYME